MHVWIAVATVAILHLLLLSIHPNTSLNMWNHWRKVLYAITCGKVQIRAPLTNCGVFESEIANSYTVCLAPSYSLNRHKEKVRGSVDLDAAIVHIHDDTQSNQVCYSAEFRMAALAAVRSDVRVGYVECNRRVQLFRLLSDDASW